jgi:hypothetical protein
MLCRIDSTLSSRAASLIVPFSFLVDSEDGACACKKVIPAKPTLASTDPRRMRAVAAVKFRRRRFPEVNTARTTDGIVTAPASKMGSFLLTKSD